MGSDELARFTESVKKEAAAGAAGDRIPARDVLAALASARREGREEERARLDPIVAAAQKLKAAHDERWARARKAREAAAASRAGDVAKGRAMIAALDRSPTVFDVGQACDEIIEALEFASLVVVPPAGPGEEPR